MKLYTCFLLKKYTYHIAMKTIIYFLPFFNVTADMSNSNNNESLRIVADSSSTTGGVEYKLPNNFPPFDPTPENGITHHIDRDIEKELAALIEDEKKLKENIQSTQYKLNSLKSDLSSLQRKIELYKTFLETEKKHKK